LPGKTWLASTNASRRVPSQSFCPWKSFKTRARQPLYSLSHNHGSGKYLYPKGNYYWRDPFLTSMIMGGSVVGGFSPTLLNKYAPQNGSSSPRFRVRIKNI